MEWAYRLGTGAYHLGVRAAAALGNDKARKWVEGRRSQAPIPPSDRPTVWMHVASLGEFEQGRPVLELLRLRLPDHRFVLTFYSPSGYERCRGTELAEEVRYLPADTPGNARKWFAEVQPVMAIFVKYDLWYYHLRELFDAGIPTFLVAASVRYSDLYVAPSHVPNPHRLYKTWYRSLLGRFTAIMAQTQVTYELLANASEVDSNRIYLTGDPRMDRVLELANTPFFDPVLDAFTNTGRPVLLAGSVWPADTDKLLPAWRSVREYYRLILAPHELKPAYLQQLAKSTGAVRYSHYHPILAKNDPAGAAAGAVGEVKKEARLELQSAEVLLLDTVGILSRAYRYGRVAYIGGGHGTGLHNTLEPMAYGLPTLFGPHHDKFPEAGTAVDRGGAFIVRTAADTRRTLDTLHDASDWNTASRAQQMLSEQNAGAAERTVSHLLRLARLTILLFLLGLPITLQAQVASPVPPDTAGVVSAISAALERGTLLGDLSGMGPRPGLSLAVANLAVDETVSLEVEVRPDRAAAFLASADDELVDIDLTVRNAATGEILGTDLEDDGVPIVSLPAGAPRRLSVQVHVAAARRMRTCVALHLLETGRPSYGAAAYLRATKRLFDRPDALPGPTGGQWFLYFGQSADESTYLHLRPPVSTRENTGLYVRTATSYPTSLAPPAAFLVQKYNRLLPLPASGRFDRPVLLPDGSPPDLVVQPDRSSPTDAVLAVYLTHF